MLFQVPAVLIAFLLTLVQAMAGGTTAADAPLSPFGIGSDAARNRSVDTYSAWIPQMQAVGLTVHRTPDSSWGTVEPEQGKWTWDNLDAQMNYLTAHHFRFGGILAGNPAWNRMDPPGNLPVNNLPAWSEYVTQTVKHADGRIKYWEIWNEPPNGTGRDQTAADYAKLVISAYHAAKTADPTCYVGLAAKSVDINYLYQAIRAGAKDHFDYIILHPYESLGTVMNHAGTEPVFLQIVPDLRKMLAAEDPARISAPVWFTELGSDASQGANVPASALIKAYAMGIAQGIACISWFEGIDGDSGPMGLLEANGTPRPAYSALRQMIKYLGEHPTFLGWVLLNDCDCGFLFQGRSEPILITWAPKGSMDTVRFGSFVTIIDPLTGTTLQSSACALTEAPTLIAGLDGDLVKTAQSNKRRPFPWKGDYTQAKSVSVVFGATNTEEGLHTQSASSVAADVILYGGSARSGSVPGGSVFMVDPNFLSYVPTPIEIRVVVRRNLANDNAGFALKYESTSGYRSCGWYTVPDNKQWWTQAWKVDDAQFVSMYGFNFALDSDGNQYNRYEIKSVTVTKLNQ